MKDKMKLQNLSSVRWDFAEKQDKTKFVFVDYEEGKRIYTEFMNAWIDSVLLSVAGGYYKKKDE